MKALYDYGEFLICIAPIFLIIWAVGFALLWNSLPSRSRRKGPSSEDPAGEEVDER
jgi:hypothetical protein